VRKRAGQRVPVLVRSIEYPSDPRSAVGKQIAAVIDAGGRRTNIEDADLLRMLALREFREQHRTRPDYASWLQGERPFTQLRVIQDILRLDELKPSAAPTPPPPAPPPSPAPPAPTLPVTAATNHTGTIRMGTTPGTPDKPWHALRHTFAAHAVMSGIPLYTVKELLGHASIEMTQRYAHLAPDYLGREVARLSFALPTDGKLRPLRETLLATGGRE
jgi:hypothetical protein